MNYKQLINLIFLVFIFYQIPSNANSLVGLVFTDNGPIGNIRQSVNDFVQINISSDVTISQCIDDQNNAVTQKKWAVALRDDHPNFDQLYAAILAAKFAGNQVQFAVYNDQCVSSGFAVVDTFTVKD